MGMRTSRKKAEGFKPKEGRAYYQSEDREEKVWLIGDFTIGDRQYPLAATTKIIEARVFEIFDIIKEQLVDADLFEPKDIASGVVLTGGSSRLAGIEEAAHRRFGLEARASEGSQYVNEELRAPEYSTAIGLLHYALTGQEDNREQAKSPGLIGILAGLFN